MVAVTGRKKGASLDDFLATLPTEAMPKSEVLAASKQELDISRETLQALLKMARDVGRVEIIEPKNKRLPQTIRHIETIKAAA